MISQNELRNALSYDPTSGIFTWKRAAGGKRIGDHAGSVDADTGYVRIGIHGTRYMAHLLAWLYVHGAFPECELDHRNRIRSDNRIKNLRRATRAQNMHNAHWPNSSGLRGVHFYKPGKYQARISVFDRMKGKTVQKSLGYYPTPEEANEAYELMAKMIHGDFYNGRH